MTLETSWPSDETIRRLFDSYGSVPYSFLLLHVDITVIRHYLQALVWNMSNLDFGPKLESFFIKAQAWVIIVLVLEN